MKYFVLASLLLTSISIQCNPTFLYASKVSHDTSQTKAITQVSEQSPKPSNQHENQAPNQQAQDCVAKLIALTYLRADLQAEKQDILNHNRCTKSYAQDDIRLKVHRRDAHHVEISAVFAANHEDLSFDSPSLMAIEKGLFKGQIIELYNHRKLMDGAKSPTQKLDDYTKCLVSDTTRFAASGNENLPISAKCVECSTFITTDQLKPFIKQVEAEIYGSNPLIRAIRKLRLKMQAKQKACEQ